jgi:hypothetical protein
MRFSKICSVFVFGMSFSLSLLASPGAKVTSEEQACEALKRAAITYHLSTRNFSGFYYCEPLSESPKYYVLGLRVRDPGRSSDEIHSNLVGWFAVRRVDGSTLDWDITEEVARPLTARPPFEK